MTWGSDVPLEEEEKMIRKAAELIHSYDMDVPAIMLFETAKPMVVVGGHLGRAFTSPIFLLLSDKLSQDGDKFFTVFQKRENIDKAIELLQEMEKEDKEKKKKSKNEERNTNKKNGWRHYLPF